MYQLRLNLFKYLSRSIFHPVYNCPITHYFCNNFFLQILVGDLSSRNSPSVMSQPQSSEMSTPEKSQCPENGMKIYLVYNYVHKVHATQLQSNTLTFLLCIIKHLTYIKLNQNPKPKVYDFN